MARAIEQDVDGVGRQPHRHRPPTLSSDQRHSHTTIWSHAFGTAEYPFEPPQGPRQDPEAPSTSDHQPLPDAVEPPGNERPDRLERLGPMPKQHNPNRRQDAPPRVP